MTTTTETTSETAADDPIRTLKHDLLHSVVSSTVTMTRGRDNYETAQRTDLAVVAFHAAALLATLADLDPERAALTIEASSEALEFGDGLELAWEAALGEGYDPQVWVDDAKQRAPQADAIEHDAIHKHFGLSYANYLVVPRTLLQSMPQEWQSKFVALLKVMEDAFTHVPQADVYDVTAGKEDLLRDMTESELFAAGIEVTGDDDLGHGPDTKYHRISDGEELDGDSYGFRPGKDPVPHYNRGRTRVEPRLGGGLQ